MKGTNLVFFLPLPSWRNLPSSSSVSGILTTSSTRLWKRKRMMLQVMIKRITIPPTCHRRQPPWNSHHQSQQWFQDWCLFYVDCVEALEESGGSGQWKLGKDATRCNLFYTIKGPILMGKFSNPPPQKKRKKKVIFFSIRTIFFTKPWFRTSQFYFSIRTIFFTLDHSQQEAISTWTFINIKWHWLRVALRKGKRKEGTPVFVKGPIW